MIGEAERVATALKARRAGSGWIAQCPCPGHGNGRGDKKPSLSIKEGNDGQLFLHCFAECDFRDILSELQRRGIINGDGSKLSRARKALATVNPVADVEPDPLAIRLWRDSIPLLGTPVQNYLEYRGLIEQPPSLRCCYHLDDEVGMVAAVQRLDGKIIAAQTKMVTRTGLKVDQSRPDTVGNLGDGAVRLAVANEIMGIAEGIETAMSAQAMAEIPVWASLGAARLHRVALPDFVHEVHIFGDNDKAGHAAAHRAGEVHQAAGRRVFLRFPPEGMKDYNDLLIAGADQCGSVAA